MAKICIGDEMDCVDDESYGYPDTIKLDFELDDSDQIFSESFNSSNERKDLCMDSLGADIWSDKIVEKRHSFDVTHLGKSDLSSDEAKKSRLTTSKSVEDVSAKCKTKQRNIRQSDSRLRLARLLGKSVSCRVRSLIDLLSSSGSEKDTDKEKRAKKAAQRKQRYKEDEKFVERYEAISIYTKLKKNQWKLRVPSSSICYDDVELTEEQRKELRKAFLMFEKGGKNKMAARDLGELLRCLGWNPSERELEEAKHELVISARGSVTFSEIERYVARRGGICNGCKDEDDIQEAFQALDHDKDGKISVNTFKHFMTTLGEKMSDSEVDEILDSLKTDKARKSEYLEYKDIIKELETTTLDDS